MEEVEENEEKKQGYRGSSYQIPCSRGGLNASINKVFIPPESMVMGSKNLNLKGARQKRGGTSKVNSTTIGASLRLMGIFDFLKPAGSQFIVFATNDGKIWKSATLTIKVGLSTNKYVNMEQFGSTLFICNNADVPQTWDGTGNAAAMTKIPSDWAGTNYPSQFIRHGKGVSERLWAIGCLSTPYRVYASKNGDGTDFTETDVAAMGTITMSGIATAEETFVIGTQTYTWKETRAGTGEVTIGATAAEAVANIVTAVTADSAVVTAEDGAGDTVVVTAATAGADGNSIKFTEASTNMSMDGQGCLGGTTKGVDGVLVTLNIDTGDGYGIVGAVEFQDNLFCFGRGKTYIIDDRDTNTINWGYDPAPFEGGVAHHRLIVKTPNDLICMAEDGEIYSVTAAMEYGDYKKASLTRDTYLHDWIKSNLRLSYINIFHAIYDPILRAIYFFVVRTGQTTVDTALVYFVDRPPSEAWMIHDNLNFASGFNASCSGLIRVGAGDYQIYTGDWSGFIWKLEQSAKNDDGNPYWSGFKTPPLDYGDGRTDKRHDRGWLLIEPQGTETLHIDWWVDGESQISQGIIADGARRRSFPLGARGNDIELQVYNNTVNEDFVISQIYLDFKVLGAKVAGKVVSPSKQMGVG